MKPPVCFIKPLVSPNICNEYLITWRNHLIIQLDDASDQIKSGHTQNELIDHFYLLETSEGEAEPITKLLDVPKQNHNPKAHAENSEDMSPYEVAKDDEE